MRMQCFGHKVTVFLSNDSNFKNTIASLFVRTYKCFIISSNRIRKDILEKIILQIKSRE